MRPPRLLAPSARLLPAGPRTDSGAGPAGLAVSTGPGLRPAAGADFRTHYAPTGFAGSTLFGPGPRSASEGELIIPEGFARFERLFTEKINSATDFELFLDLCCELDPSLALIVALYRESPVPVTYGGEEGSSACFRSGLNAVQRIVYYADEVALEKDANVFWAIHEIGHAIRLAELVEAEEAAFDESTARLVARSLFPEGHPFHDIHRYFGPLYDPKSDQRPTFTRFVGEYVRDEGFSGLLEVWLLRALRAKGFAVPVYSPHLDEGLAAFAGSGDNVLEFLASDRYLGDNHFLIYNLRGLYLIAQGLQEDPSALSGLIMSDRLDVYGFFLGEEVVLPVDLSAVSPRQVFRSVRNVIEKSLSLDHPLLPMQRRLISYLAVSDVARTLFDLSDRPGEARRVYQGSRSVFPDRPRSSPAGERERIGSEPEQTCQRVILTGTCVGYLERLYAFSAEEVEANLEAYLRYAERCPPHFAARVYASLERSLFAHTIEPRAAMLFAHSCFESGYVEIGMGLLVRALCREQIDDPAAIDLAGLKAKDIRALAAWETRWNPVVSHLAENGRWDIARLIITAVEKGQQQLRRDYKAGVMAELTASYGITFRGTGRRQIAVLLRSYPDDVISPGLVLAHIRRLADEGLYGIKFEGPFRRFNDDQERAENEARVQIALEAFNRDQRDAMRRSWELKREVLTRCAQAGTCQPGSKVRGQLQNFYAAACRETKRWKKRLQGSLPSDADSDGFDAFLASVYRKSPASYLLRVGSFYSEQGEFSWGERVDFEAILLWKRVAVLEGLLGVADLRDWCRDRIEKLPDCQAKLNLMEAYWAQNAEAMSSMRRRGFLSRWEALIDRLASGLHRWDYVECPAWRSERRSAARNPADFRHSHFYHERRLRFGQALLDCDDEGLRQQGKRCLEAISSQDAVSAELYESRSSRRRATYDPETVLYREYASYHGRVRAQLLLAGYFPAEADDFLAEAETLLRSSELAARVDHALLREVEASLLSELAKRWASRGQWERVEGLQQVLRDRLGSEIGNLRSMPPLPAIPAGARRVTEDMIGQLGASDILDRQHRARTNVHYLAGRSLPRVEPARQQRDLQELERDMIILLPVRLCVRRSGCLEDDDVAMIASVCQRLRDDVDGRAWYYPLSSIILAAVELCQRDELQAEGRGLFELAIVALALQRGAAREGFERDGHALVRSIWDAPLTEPEKDALFGEFVEALFPGDRKDIWGQSFDRSFVSGTVQEPGLFHRVFETDRMPHTERALLAKLMTLRDELAFDRTLSPSMRARRLHVLTEIFVHVAQRGEFLDPELYSTLVALAPDDQAFRGALALIHPEEARSELSGEAGYPSAWAIERGYYQVDALYQSLRSDLAAAMQPDADLGSLRLLVPLICSLFRRELRSAGVVRVEALAVYEMLAPFIAEVCQGRCAPSERQRLVLEALLELRDQEVANLSVLWLKAIFDCPTVETGLRRLAFASLCQGGRYSAYVRTKQEACVASEDLAAEASFYNRLVQWEGFSRRRDDFSLSLWMEAEPDRAQALVDATEALAKGFDPRADKGNYKRIGRIRRWKYDVMDPVSREFYFYASYRQRHVQMESAPKVRARLEVPVQDFEEDWYEDRANLVRALALRVLKDESEFRSRVHECWPDCPRGTMDDLLGLFREPYTAVTRLLEDRLHEELSDYFKMKREEESLEHDDPFTDGAGVYVGLDQAWDHDGFGHVDERYAMFGEDEPDWEERVDQYLKEDERDRDFDEDPFGDDRTYSRDRAHSEGLDLEGTDQETQELFEILCGVFESYALATLEGRINTYVFTILPGASRRWSQAQHWSFSKISWHLDNMEPLTMDEAAERLDRLHASLMQERRNRAIRCDQIRICQIKVPELFGDRAPLEQFFLLRYLLEMPLGEREALLLELAELSEGAFYQHAFRRTDQLKVGQFLSIWPEVPPAYREHLSGFQDEVRAFDVQAVRDVVLEEQGEELATLLLTMLDPDPLNAATIGEVYALRKRETSDAILDFMPASQEAIYRAASVGDIVAVMKVIPVPKRTKNEGVLRIYRRMGDLLDIYQDRFPGARTARRVLAEIVASIEEELDLTQEEVNIRRFVSVHAATQAAPPVRVPTVWEGVTTPSVMLMSYEPGTKLTELEDRKRAVAAGRALGAVLSNMILYAPFFHDDLHPGNSALGEDGQLIVYDFGRLASSTERERALIPQFLAAASRAQADPDSFVAILEQMGERASDYERPVLTAALRQMQEGGEPSADPFEQVAQVFSIAGENGLIVDRVYLRVLKAMLTHVGTMRSLEEDLTG
jgi:predicted unusual protein kinase regulating ubiquinone biosynthesis (AarF/ABC1/UbiB family)